MRHQFSSQSNELRSNKLLLFSAFLPFFGPSVCTKIRISLKRRYFSITRALLVYKYTQKRCSCFIAVAIVLSSAFLSPSAFLLILQPREKVKEAS